MKKKIVVALCVLTLVLGCNISTRAADYIDGVNGFGGMLKANGKTNYVPCYPQKLGNKNGKWSLKVEKVPGWGLQYETKFWVSTVKVSSKGNVTEVKRISKIHTISPKNAGKTYNYSDGNAMYNNGKGKKVALFAKTTKSHGSNKYLVSGYWTR